MRIGKWLAAGAGACALAAVAQYESRADTQPRTIAISAKRYEYTPDRIVLTKGEPVKLELTTEDRAHGFLLKPLKIDADIKPGATTEVDVTPDTPGTYTVVCDHYCGIGHGGMKMTIVVQ